MPQLSSTGRRFPWIFVAGGLVALGLLLALGTWQVQRLAWKEGLIATIESRVQDLPRPVFEIERLFAETGDVDYRPMTVEGRFLHAHERHFFATWKGSSGFYVYTPLRMADGRLLWVNRGFVPYDRKDPASRSEGQVEGETVVTGLARNPLAEKPSALVPDNDPEANVFHWKDLAAMTASAGLEADAEVLPFFLDADDTPNEGGLPVGGVTMIDLPNNHLQYAVTWYGLAAVLAVVMAVWIRRWKRSAP